MKSKLLIMRKVCFAFFFLSVFFSYAQSGIKIKYYDGSEQSFAVSATGKLYFSSDQLLIKTDAASTATSLPISIIKKITFTDYLLGTAGVGENKASLKMYPNPATDYFKISGLKEKSLLQIYSLSGQLLHSQNYSPDANVDVSQLKSGVYLIQINQVTFKLIRK